MFGVIILIIIVVIVVSAIIRYIDDKKSGQLDALLTGKQAQGFSCQNCAYVETEGKKGYDAHKFALHMCGLNSYLRQTRNICNLHIYSDNENKYQYWKA